MINFLPVDLLVLSKARVDGFELCREYLPLVLYFGLEGIHMIRSSTMNDYQANAQKGQKHTKRSAATTAPEENGEEGAEKEEEDPPHSPC